MGKLKLGVNKNINNAEYHADRDYLSSSVLKEILKDPALYEAHYLKGEEKVKPSNQNALDEGSYAHSLILEPHLVANDYQFYQGYFKRGREFEAFKAEADPRKPILSLTQKEKIDSLHKAHVAHFFSPSLIEGAEVEHTLCVELAGVPVKVRFDALQVEQGRGADVKTTGYTGDVESFKQTVKDLQYDLSAALYTMAAEQVYGRPFDFYFIVLSKLARDCNVYKTSQETLNAGKRKVIEALNLYKQCKASGVWKKENEPEKITGQNEILEV